MQVRLCDKCKTTITGECHEVKFVKKYASGTPGAPLTSDKDLCPLCMDQLRLWLQPSELLMEAK